MTTWTEVTPGKRWIGRNSEGGRLAAVIVGAELREYWEEARGGPRVYVHEVADCAGQCKPSHDLPVCVRRAVTEAMPVESRFAPWVRALDDRELLEWLEDHRAVAEKLELS